MIYQIPSRITIPAPHSIRHQSPTLGINYGRQPIRYEMLPQICRELGLRWLVHPLDKPARLVRHHYGTMLIVNALASEPVRWIAALEYIGHYLGVPRSQVLEFASIAALAGLALDDSLTGQAEFRTDHNGLCIYATAEACELVGVAPFDLNWLKGIEPTARETTRGMWQQSVRCGLSVRRTHRFHHKNGQCVQVISTALPVLMDGKLLGYQGQLRAL